MAKQNILSKQKKAIEQWLDDSEYSDYISFDWDGETLDIFMDKQKPPVTITRQELIDEHDIELDEDKSNKSEEGVDLFEDYDSIPANVKKVLAKHAEGLESGDYRNLEKALKDLKKIGYTFEYYLDGQPYDLRKIGQKGKTKTENEVAPILIDSISSLSSAIDDEIKITQANDEYEDDDKENLLFEKFKEFTGYDYEDSPDDHNYVLKATKYERLKFLKDKITELNNKNSRTDAQVIAEIETKIKESCNKSKYTSLCQRIQTQAGLAYVVNRCINMMAKDKLHLGTCLANLEAEEEGIS